MLKVNRLPDGGFELERDGEMEFEDVCAIVPKITRILNEKLLEAHLEKMQELKQEATIARFFAFFFAGVAIYCILKLYGVL